MHRRYFALLLGVMLAAAAEFFALPVPAIDAPVSAVLLDRNGDLLGATVAADQQWRFPGRDEVPEKFADALVTFEDKRFHEHGGVDPLALGRALWLDLRHREVRSGASTITMQVVRMSRGNPPRTLSEKLVEIVLALRLESARSKEEILAMYAANAPMGGNTVGLDAAAWRYFGRDAADLSWAEAATLAVLPNDPALVHPGRNREALRNKRDRLLGMLVDAGHLTAAEAELARAEDLPDAPHAIPQLAPHLLAKASGRVMTTLDARLQARAAAVLERHHAQLEGNGVHNAAALVVDVETGDVLAYVGNTGGLGQDHGQHVDVVTAPRSTGSTLKPFLYGAMLEDGELLPNQIVPDVPMRIGGLAPENFDREYDGAVPAAEALARSRNVPAVWMLRRHGVGRFQAELTRMGMTTLHRDADDYGLSLILGGSEGTLWDLTSMYRNLAWAVDGRGHRPEVSWRAGHDGDDRRDTLGAGAAWLTLDALEEVARPGTDASWRSFDSGRPVAWKTGTSFGFRDAWAIGVTPRLAIGVWAGNADGEGRPGLTGLTAAAPILFELFDIAGGPADGFDAPDEDLEVVRVCAHSGHLAGRDCAATRLERVPRGAPAGTPCPYCTRLHLDPAGKEQVNASCSEMAAMRHEPWFVLPPDMAWFYARRNAAWQAPPPMRAGCEDEPDRSFSLLYPVNGGEVYVPIELNGTRGRVVFEAAHRDRDGRLFWHLDGDYLGATEGVHQMALAPVPGPHVLTVVDASGAAAMRRFTVL